MGPSGAGKSSLLNIIAGRNVSSAKGKTVGGAVWLGDERIDLQSNSGRSELRSTIAYVLQGTYNSIFKKCSMYIF